MSGSVRTRIRKTSWTNAPSATGPAPPYGWVAVALPNPLLLAVPAIRAYRQETVVRQPADPTQADWNGEVEGWAGYRVGDRVRPHAPRRWCLRPAIDFASTCASG